MRTKQKNCQYCNSLERPCECYKPKPHTPIPWRIEDAGHAVFGPRPGSLSPEIVAFDLTRGNAEFIVRACNAHDELLEALKWVRDHCTGLPAVARVLADKAIEKAEGGK